MAAQSAGAQAVAPNPHSYRVSVEQLAAHAKKAPEDATREDVESFIIDQPATKSPATAAIRYRSLQQWYRWLLEEDELERSPMANMKPLQDPEQPVPIVADDKIKKLLKVCEGKGFDDRRDTAIIRLFADIGGQLSEIGDLSVNDMKWDDEGAIVTGKGDRRRALPFRPSAAQAFDRYLRGTSTDTPSGPSCGSTPEGR
jgi:integrase/recombinase XerC